MARLLFDQNLSFRLVAALSDLFPESQHLGEAGLARADDATVWSYAGRSGLTVVTKDSDFHQMSFLYGPPPKVIWIRAGNCSTDQAIALIRRNAVALSNFIESADEALFVLDPTA